MKKLILETSIIIMLVLVPFATAASDRVTSDADEHLVAAIVIDCSDVGHVTWKRSLILARQAMSLLKAGDELIVITARRDRNVIETTCLIDPGNAGQRTRLNQKLMALEYNWWCRAKIAEALQLAYSEMNNRPSGRKCCIVLSDGRYDNSEVEDIRRKAAVYRLSGISLLMTVTGSANKDLLLAGSQGELDVAILEQTDLAGWFDR
ncbi:MAG: VWA domain-containing protein, partial [Planctomycetota bacterium]|nr:VWA domain-containing protein [Planctomycetota bacterium]